ncbi:MAG TPA: stalk domain-containing protein [Symbiobacteriaceae bacterium]|jgi:hypothetical protein
MKLRSLAPLLAALIVGIAAGSAVTGVAMAQYSLADNCVVKSNLHFVFEGVDQTPYAGTLPDGHPAGFICDGRTYVPLRWLSEMLGKQVTWDGATSTINVSGAEWNENGVTMTIADVLPGPQRSSVNVQVRNTSSRNQLIRLDVNFYDGSGKLLGIAKGPDSTATLASGETQMITAVSETSLAGYAYLSVTSDVTPAGLYSHDTRSGISEVDRFLDAVMEKNGDALNRLITMEKQPCTTEPGGSDPRPVCPPGTPAGTVIDVFPTGHCQLSYAYGLESAQRVVGNLLLSRPLWVYAIYRIGPTNPAGYAVVLASSPDDRQAAVVYLGGGGGIVEARTICNDPSTDVPKQADFVLPPKNRSHSPRVGSPGRDHRQ